MENLTKEMESYITEYDKIIIFDDRDGYIASLKKHIMTCAALHASSKKYIFLGLLPYDESEVLSYVRVIPEEYDKISSLYCMYEFTDKIIFISKTPRHGLLLNYVSAGVLTEDEYYEALLH